jgi:hypothetical protein
MRGTLEKIERTAGMGALERFKVDAFNALQSVRQTDGFHHIWSVLYTLATNTMFAL